MIKVGKVFSLLKQVPILNVDAVRLLVFLVLSLGNGTKLPVYWVVWFVKIKIHFAKRLEMVKVQGLLWFLP
jgi:hypothetical protein